jgi:N-methylhydantoinase A
LAQPEAIAVSFLFSYLNDEHERKVGDALREALPDIPVTLSSEVAREFREYPRTATTAINAALRPLVERYLQKASQALQDTGVEAPFLVMQSNGGSVPAERAGVEAHRLVLSGPAGGVAGLIGMSRALKEPHLISLDMGGTSTDVCLVRDGHMPFTTLQEVQDHTLLAPTVDIHTIGAGGGSIAWVDQTGRLRVGPQSAKAVPGPACYDRGGIEPTITDAHAVLGTLGGGELADGLTLKRELAVAAVQRIADPLQMTVEEAAEAILAIGLAHMVRALRKVSVERGLDPREFSLVPFGGAGPLHAGLLLRHMELKQAIVPLRPGLFSADGLLVAGLRVDRSQTILKPADYTAFGGVIEWFSTHSEQIREQLISDGVPGNRITEEAVVDCRYRGQGFELSVPISDWSLSTLERLPETFHHVHRERYGHSNDEEPVEIVTIRLASTGQIDRSDEEAVPVAEHSLDALAIVSERKVILPGYGETTAVVIDRRRITAGATFQGPAIIQQMDATTVILPEQSAKTLSTLDLVITDNTRKVN